MAALNDDVTADEEDVVRRASTRLILEVDVDQRLPVGVADDEAGVGLLDGLGRRKAAEFVLVDHRTIADPRLQAAQGQRCDADLEMRETPAVGMHCRGLSARGQSGPVLRRLIEAPRG